MRATEWRATEDARPPRVVLMRVPDVGSVRKIRFAASPSSGSAAGVGVVGNVGGVRMKAEQARGRRGFGAIALAIEWKIVFIAEGIA